MGLLDGFFSDDPRQQAQMALAMGLLSGRGGKGVGGFMRDLGQAGTGAMQVYNQASMLGDRRKEEEQQRAMRQMQMDEMKRGMDYNAAFGKAITPAQPASQTFAPTDYETPSQFTPARPQGIDWAALQRIDPRRALQDQSAFAAAQAKERSTYKPGDTVGRWEGNKFIPEFTAPKEPDLPPGMRMGANGPEWIPGYLSGKKEVSAAGAPRVDVRYGNTLGSELGKGTAAVLTDGRTKAEAARDSIVQGHQILEALDQGGAYTGPGASVKLKAAQIAPILGFKGDPEGVNRTRAVITGLANQTLNARGLLKGQGQITEYEQKTLEKAKSGNIDEMTADEIRTIIAVNERVSRAQIGAHSKIVTTLGKKPEFAEVLPFYQIDEPAPYSGTRQGKRRVYNQETGMIEER